MSRSNPPSNLTSLTVIQLQALANDVPSFDTLQPREYLERARMEADKAILAERRDKKEEMYVAYLRACMSYTHCKMHAGFGEEKRRDPAWGERVKGFRETYDAFMLKAKELKEVLRTREVEQDESVQSTTASKPPIQRSPTGPEEQSIGSIADRMKALSGKGMDVGPTAKRLSGNPGPMTVTGGGGTFGVSRIPPSRQRAGSSSSGEKDHPVVNGHGKKPYVPPKPFGLHSHGNGTPQGEGSTPSIGALATGSSTKSDHGYLPNGKSINVIASSAKASPSPTTSWTPMTPTPSTPTHISPAHSGSSVKPPTSSVRSSLPSIPQYPPRDPSPPQATPERPTAPTPSVKDTPDRLADFSAAFPSLSEFGKQFEDLDDRAAAFRPQPNGEYPFGRDPDSKASIEGLPGVEPTKSGDRADSPEIAFPEIPAFPDLPSVPDIKPGQGQNGHGMSSPVPDLSDLQRPASTSNVHTILDNADLLSGSPPDISTLAPSNSRPLPQPNIIHRENSAPTSSHSSNLTFPVAKPTPAPPPHPSSQPLQPALTKPKFPITNGIEPDTVRTYLLNPAVDMVIFDVRTEAEFERNHVGQEYEARGAKVRVVWIDPTVLMRDGMDAAKLEDALSLLPEAQRRAFDLRHKADLVVVYDSTSKTWPKGKETTPLSRLWDIVYEHEFTKKLERTPVLLVGGYAGWMEFIRGRAAFHAANARSRGVGRIVNGGVAHPNSARSGSGSGSGEGKRSNRDQPVYQAAPYVKNITDHMGYAPQSMTGETSYTGSQSRPYVSSPPPLPPSTHRPHASTSTPFAYSSRPIPAPPQASIHPGPGARRRSDYVEQHNQPYTGYTPPPQPSSHPPSHPHIQKHTTRPSIDYPRPHGVSSAPIQPPPAAQGHGMERYDPRPGVVRSGSIRGLDLVAREGDEVRYWNDVALGLTGLKNLGNTCYMNSTLQCLSATYPFTTFFLDGSFKRSINKDNPLGLKGNLALAFAELLKALWKEDYTFLSPVTFRKNIISFSPQFTGTDQHDSQEFLSFVLDGLHEDLNRIKVKPAPIEMTPEREHALETLPTEVASQKEWDIYRMRNDSFIVDLFQGQYRNRLECLTCHKTSTTFDTFMYMSLPVPAGKKGVVVQELIDEFVKAEVMEGEDAWNCPRCKVPRRATKTLTIARLPPVLLIQLKRFTTQNGLFWDKSETPVIFPVKGLDLTRYIPYRQSTGLEDLDDPRTQIGPFRYDLYGVSNHMGSLSNGHYTAYVKSSKGWQFCEDSKVTKAHEKDVVSRPAYILFYKRIKV